jgi:hypothetical protein
MQGLLRRSEVFVLIGMIVGLVIIIGAGGLATRSCQGSNKHGKWGSTR